ncbi:MAG: hypothetical protein E6R03_15125 [Hyphomicrobiaceae bacterium]|nr:MAG: hypothetical protein E6R03_15125 [Hyphomicrobiaceae bacterium]
MDEKEAVKRFVAKWLDSAQFGQWLPKQEFDKQSYTTKLTFYEKAEHRLCTVLGADFLNSPRRDEMCQIMSVGLWEKDRRAGNLPFDPQLWASHAAQRVRDRRSGKIRDMPLVEKDAQVYLGLIEREIRRYADES